MAAICGLDCESCGMRAQCKGCSETDGRPFGGDCVVAQCFKRGGENAFSEYKARLLREFNALGIPDMPEVTELCALSGAYVNLEYTLIGGQKAKLLDDGKIYLGYQVEITDSDKCYGLVADDEYLLVSRYGEGGADPEIIAYIKRRPL